MITPSGISGNIEGFTQDFTQDFYPESVTAPLTHNKSNF